MRPSEVDSCIALVYLHEIEYEHDQHSSGMRVVMGVMVFEEFRLQYSPLIPILIDALHKTYLPVRPIALTTGIHLKAVGRQLPAFSREL